MQVTTRAAHIAYDGKVYIVAGLAAPNAFQQADDAFLASIRSFRPLSAAEAEDIRPNRVDLYVVRAGDTWQSIAERSGGVINAGDARGHEQCRARLAAAAGHRGSR